MSGYFCCYCYYHELPLPGLLLPSAATANHYYYHELPLPLLPAGRVEGSLGQPFQNGPKIPKITKLDSTKKSGQHRPQDRQHGTSLRTAHRRCNAWDKPKPHNKTRGGPCWDAWAVAAGCSAGCKQSETQFQSRSGIWVQVSKVVVDTWSQMKGRMGLSPRYGREFHPFVRPYSKISKFLCEKSSRYCRLLERTSLCPPPHIRCRRMWGAATR